MQYRRLTLTNAERLTLAGTAEVFLDDFDAYTEAWQTPANGQQAIGTPYIMQTDQILLPGYFAIQFQRLTIQGPRRLTIQGQQTDYILTDFTQPTGRAVLQGRF